MAGPAFSAKPRLNRAVAVVPLALLALVALMDSLPVASDGWLAIGSVDEPAHLSTALILLLAVGGRSLPLRHRTFFLSAAAGAVLIDLDHIPLYAGVPHIALPGDRPYSHSLMTPLALGLLAWALPRWRTVLGGLAVGVLLHFVRDIATGPGLPIWWPFQDTSHTIPYDTYFTAISGLAVVATVRLAWPARPGHFQPETPTAAANGLVSDAE